MLVNADTSVATAAKFLRDCVASALKRGGGARQSLHASDCFIQPKFCDLTCI